MKTDIQRRYARHLVLPDIGEKGQEKLFASSVLIIGAGGLGTAAAGYLAAMGVGRIGLIDHDRVELSNLQRQLLYETGDTGRLKVEAARDRLEDINPGITIELIAERLTGENVAALVARYDLVVDGSDNFETRFAAHDACFKEGKTLISAAISAFAGQISVFKAHLGPPHPCYRCFVSAAPERARACAQEGVIGALPGVMGSLQALEAVKELLGIGKSLSGHLIFYDALAGNFRKVLLQRDPLCETCSSFVSAA